MSPVGVVGSGREQHLALCGALAERLERCRERVEIHGVGDHAGKIDVAARHHVGRDMEIMVELHGLWTLPPVLRIAEALKDYDVAWLEEPIRYNELDAMAELARHTSIPIAASERLASRQMF